MSQKPPRLPPDRRKEIIKEYIAQETESQIAERCGVVRETISRDIREMRESGEWEEWLEQEYLRLHRQGDFGDDLRYKEIAKLYGKTLTQKMKAEITADVESKLVAEIDWESLTDEEREGLITAARTFIRRGRGETRPSDVH